MEVLLQWVKKLAVFMILSSYMEHLLPLGYKRYFHMCMGLLLILMIGTPLIRILNGNVGGDFIYLLEDLKTGSGVYQFEDDSAQVFQEYYMEQYREAVGMQIRQMAESCGLIVTGIDFDVDEDVESERYGRLERAVVRVRAGESLAEPAAELRKSLMSQLGMQSSQIRIQME